jgi:membrane-anchored protein YejM (alkaline phosphatase superfamily)
VFAPLVPRTVTAHVMCISVDQQHQEQHWSQLPQRRQAYTRSSCASSVVSAVRSSELAVAAAAAMLLLLLLHYALCASQTCVVCSLVFMAATASIILLLADSIMYAQSCKLSSVRGDLNYQPAAVLNHSVE